MFRIFLITLAGLLSIGCSVQPEPEDRTVSASDFITHWLEAEGYDTKGLVVSKDGPDLGGDYTRLYRNEKLVGYHKIDTVWERRGKESENLNGITSIEFGYEPPNNRAIFIIKDPEQIAIWCSEYINTTEHAKHTGRLIPLTKDAGFPELQCEAGKGSGHCCSLGLRFFRKNKVILTLDGHLDKSPEFDGELKRNEALYRFVRTAAWRARKAAEEREAQNWEQDPNEPSPFDE